MSITMKSIEHGIFLRSPTANPYAISKRPILHGSLWIPDWSKGTAVR